MCISCILGLFSFNFVHSLHIPLSDRLAVAVGLFEQPCPFAVHRTGQGNAAVEEAIAVVVVIVAVVVVVVVLADEGGGVGGVGRVGSGGTTVPSVTLRGRRQPVGAHLLL